MYNWVSTCIIEFLSSSHCWLKAAPRRGRCSTWSEFTSCMHTVALFTYFLSLCLTFLGWPPLGWITVTLHTRGPRVRACGRSPRSLDSTVHTRQKHFLDPCHSAGVMECRSRANLSAPPWPWHIYSAWHFLTQRVGLIWLSVSKGWMAGRLASPSGSWRKNTFSN